MREVRLSAPFALLILLSPCVAPRPAAAWTDSRARKLDAIQAQLKSARDQILLYQNMEESLSRQTQDLEDSRARISEDMDHLKRQLSGARENRRVLELRLSALSRASGLWRAQLAAEIQDYADSLWQGGDFSGSRDPWRGLLIRSAVQDQAAVLRRLNGLDQTAGRAQEEKLAEEARIQTQSRQAQAQAQAEDAQYQDALAKIAAARQKKTLAQARARELEASAQALTRLLGRLRRRARARQGLPALWTPARNSLSWPAQGRVVQAFGRSRDPVTGVWTISRGILISASPAAPVAAIADGQVIYAGNFRSYGEVLILDHGGNFFSIYGRLGALLKSAGQSVKSGDVIARAGPASPNGNVYLEIRQGSQALNPLDWLKTI